MTDATALKNVLQKHAEQEAQAKEASETELNARLNAFEFGVDVLCKQANLDKAALAQAAGLKSPVDLAPALVAWLTQETEAK